MSTIETIQIPGNLFWVDETEWVAVEQPEPGRGLDGSLLVEPSSMIGGRPITLVGSEKYPAWVPYKTVRDLLSLAGVPGKISKLIFDDGREFDVMFRYHDGGPVTATPVVVSLPLEDNDDCWIVIRLMEVII